MAEARNRLRAARGNLELGEAGVAAGVAYYAMLYAARAALSERDLYAKTHAGTWSLFSREFVEPGFFDSALAARASRIQRVREEADYEARPPSLEQASELVEEADGFVTAVIAMLAERP